VQTYIPDTFEYLPDKKIFLARAGVRYSNVDDPEFLKKVNFLFLEALQYVSAKVWYDVFEISHLKNEAVPSVFKGAKKITVFVSTLGKKLDEVIEERSKIDLFESYILDAWGSEAVEKLNESFDKKLREQFGRGTMRFSPGYGDIDIRLNKYFVKELLGVDEIDVLESGILVPRKSTVCMIGWLE